MAKVWDELDNQFLRENYMKLSNQDLAGRFGVSKKSIQGKLRRLGLHRVEEDESPKIPLKHDESVKKKDERPVIGRKRLNFEIPQPPPKPPVKVAYVPKEMTEKRKRAIREFENAIKILASGAQSKAQEEFDFIINTFGSELDIVDKAKLFKKTMHHKSIPEPQTAEEFFHRGTWLYRNNKLQEALTHYEQVLALDPDYPDTEYNMACLLCQLGRHEEALKKLKSALDKQENLVEVAAYDEDFEPIWESSQFIELIQSKMSEEPE